jgi:hypothetical protein
MPAGPGFPREKSPAFHLRKNCARRTKGMQGRSSYHSRSTSWHSSKLTTRDNQYRQTLDKWPPTKQLTSWRKRSQFISVFCDLFISVGFSHSKEIRCRNRSNIGSCYCDDQCPDACSKALRANQILLVTNIVAALIHDRQQM